MSRINLVWLTRIHSKSENSIFLKKTVYSLKIEKHKLFIIDTQSLVISNNKILIKLQKVREIQNKLPTKRLPKTNFWKQMIQVL